MFLCIFYEIQGINNENILNQLFLGKKFNLGFKTFM